MSGSVRIDPALVKQAADELNAAAGEMQRPLAADAQLEAARNAHGPIFAELKEALAATLAARREEILDQIAFGTGKAEEMAMWAVQFEADEQERAHRQGSVGQGSLGH